MGTGVAIPRRRTAASGKVASTPGGEVAAVAEDISEGSELGSDLDDDYDSIFDGDNEEAAAGPGDTVVAEITSVKRTKSRWDIDFKNVVLNIDGIECLFTTVRAI